MQSFTQHPQWPEVEAVCRKLHDAGFLAYLAGGCVRDALLGRAPQDFDIATDALPEQVISFFPASLEVGKAFGVVVLPREGFQIEVATFRSDGQYTDGRRPESVVYSTPKEDALRRDFTINALFFDLKTQEILDFVEGEKDIEAKILRAVGDPLTRFSEDKLRILRGVRFASQLAFAIEPDTWAALRNLAPDVLQVSQERIRDELCKLFLSKHRSSIGLPLLRESGLCEILFRFPITDLAFANLKKAFAIAPSDASLELLWTLFYSILKEGHWQVGEFKDILRDFRFSSSFIDNCAWYLNNQSLLQIPDSARVADILMVLAHERAASAETLSFLLAEIRGFREEELRIQAKRTALRIGFLQGRLPNAFIGGDDLKALGITPGPQFGELIKEAYRLQLEKRLIDRQQALQWLQEQLSAKPTAH